MTELTAQEQAILRKTNYRIKRYLSFCPRDIIFQCKSTAQFDTDSKTGGWVAIDYDTVSIGNYGDIKPGMTLDVGAVGSVRVRKAATASKIYIAETGGGDLTGQGFVDDVTMTVHNERRIWPKFPYMNKTASGDYYDTFDYTVDYDVDYTDETDNYPPIVNITGDIAGFSDALSYDTEFENPATGLVDYFDLNNGAAYAETSYASATFTASSENGANVAGNAFDDNLSTAWENSGAYPQWLKAQLASAATINAYTVIPTAGGNAYPTAWTFEGSNNDSDWDTLDTRSGEQILAGFAQTYEVTTPGSYEYYRIVITAGAAASTLLVELDLHEAVPAQTKLDQHFVSASGNVDADYIELYLKRTGTPSGTLTVRVETDSANKPTGTLMAAAATGTASEADVDTAGGWVRFALDGTINILNAVEYHIILSSSSSESTSNYISWGYSSDTIYDQAMRLVEPNNTLWSRETAYDFLLRMGTTSGGTTRAVTLDASDSEAVADSATIASYLWDLDDGDFASGYSDSDATIVAEFPEGRVFRYISCTVTDSNGTSATRYYPIFVHSTLHPPLPANIGFKIERDETSMVGREMDVVVYGQVDAATDDVIPEGTLAIYWEEITFDGDSAPSAYRNQFMGWTMRDSTRMSLNRDQYLVTISGPGYWLQQMRGFPMSFLDRDSPSEWYHMADPTDDRAIVTILRYFTTFLDLCGLHQSDRADEWHQPTGSDYAAIKVEKASIWEQVVMLTAEYSGVNGCDTNGDMWLTRHPCLRYFAPTREAVDNLITLTAADRDDGQPLEIPKQHYKPYGLVQLDGFWWDSSAGVNRAGRAKAPGRTPGFGTQEEIKAAQAMVGATKGTANINLAGVAGEWYAWLNSPVKEVQYRLVGNLDVAEPARVEWITVSDNDTVRGNKIDAERFIVERVTVNHSFEPGQPPKRITWYISQETDGQRGAVVYIPTTTVVAGDWIDPGTWYPDSWSPEPVDGGQWLKGEMSQIALVTDGGDLYTTSNFLDDEPDWTDTGVSFSGTPQQLCANPFSPGYINGTGAVNAWVVTSTNLYYVTDIFGTPSVSSQLTFRTPSGSIANHSIDASFGTEGHACVVSYYGEDGTYSSYTTNTGSSWSAEAQITAYYQTDTTTYADIFPGVYCSPKTAGLVYTTAFSSQGNGAGYVSTNYGSSWAAANGSNGPQMITGRALADDIHVPYGHSDELLAYHGKVDAADYVTGGWYLGTPTDTADLSTTRYPAYREAALDDAYMLAIYIEGVTKSGTSDTIKRDDPDYDGAGAYDHKFTTTGSDHLEDELDGNGDVICFCGSATVAAALFTGGENVTVKPNGEDTLWTETIASPVAGVGDILAAALQVNNASRGLDITGGTASFAAVYNVNSPNSTAASGYYLYKTDETTNTDVSPTDISDEPYGPYGYSRWRVTSYPLNSNYMLAVGWRDGDTGGHIHISSDGGGNWTSRSADDTDYTRGCISGDNKDIIYVWGKDGAIAISDDFGTTSSSKMGDLSISDEIIGIIGGIT